MQITVFWEDDEKTIIRSESSGHWTWDDYHEAVEKVVMMANSVNYRVDLIISALPGAVAPSGSSMPHYQRAWRIMPKNVRLNIVVNSNTFGRMIINTFTRLNTGKGGLKVIAAGSLDEARAVIARDRSAMRARVG